MFGYIGCVKEKLSEEEQKRYQSIYCGLCRNLKERYGQVERLCLSYDMAFLILLLSSLYEPEELPADATVKIPAGTYTLKAYNAAYNEQESWGNNEPGEAAYYAETSFDIAENATNTVNLPVPIVNFGVSLCLPEGFDSWFHNATFSVLSGTRSVQLGAGKTAYFPYSEGAQFTYTLAALNQDNENNTDTGTYTTVEAGTVYTVTYSLPEGLSVSRL